MNFKKDLSEIADNYDYFILDIWGVLHDGTHVYEGAIESLEHLRAKNKKICLLSNAPRRAQKVVVLLENLGIKRELYDFILTSGEATYASLFDSKSTEGYYYIGPEKDADLLHGLGCNIAADAADAGFALVTGFDDGNYDIATKIPQLKAAMDNNLTLICANPDLIVIKKSGEELLCAGIIAEEYKKMGGKVTYFGKPHKLVYEQVFKLFSNVDKSTILAVGDGLETDILGANRNQIDSALIGGGILANKLKIKHGDLPDEKLMKEICDQYSAYPTFVIGSL
ncbi:MAG: HAD superfamily hydrolase (TIGR01459 family) [Rickettsiales bacterium]|jgi:HAD superfamily hydrolase (TIGR01459 family)